MIVPVTELAALLERVGRYQPLPANGTITFLPGVRGAAVAAVLGFTAHHVIAADADPQWLTSQLADSGMTRPMKSDFLAALGRHLHARTGGQDTLLVARGLGPQTGADDVAVAGDPAALDHPRVDRALRYRQDLRVATMPGGLVTIGRGLAGRWEVSIEVEAAVRGVGIGRALAERGRALIPADSVLWAQVHPANVASMRVFLAAGYRPVGAEVLFTRDSGAPPR